MRQVAHEIRSQHRRYQSRDKQREQHRDGDRQPELLEVLAGNAAHKTDRREHRHDRKCDGDDGETNFIRRLQRCLIRRLSHPDVTRNVLDLHDRIIDQDTRGNRDGEQTDEVQREPERIHHPIRRDDRQRQRNRRDQRCPPVPQKHQHDENRERRPFKQCLHR